jgi:predicted nucleic acid-binding protein
LSQFVLDASAALPWLFEDEATPETEVLLDVVTVQGAVVPALWFLECANALATAERRGRVDPSRMAQNVDLLRRLPLQVDDTVPVRALDAALELARQHRLSAYDASYLDLALRRRLPLATGDARLRAAARAAGVALHEPAGEADRSQETSDDA